MLEKELYKKYDNSTKKEIDNFFKLLIEWRTNNFIKVLEGYSNLIGNAVNEEMRCYFASEFSKNEEEYFGDTGIAFYFDYPAVDNDCIIILSNMEFYDILNQKCSMYIEKQRLEEPLVVNLLREIKDKLNS